MNRAINLTNQPLTFARGGAPQKERIHIAGIIKDIVDFDLSGSNVRLVFTEPPALWPVEVDKGQIEQVFSNLTINARQAMPRGGLLYITLENTRAPIIPATIGNQQNRNTREDPVSYTDQRKFIKITVKDEGSGIEEKYLDRIFDPYFSTKQTGSGLGLSTAYSIIKKHDGYIVVDSKLGEGTTFTIFLPASGARPHLQKK